MRTWYLVGRRAVDEPDDLRAERLARRTRLRPKASIPEPPHAPHWCHGTKPCKQPCNLACTEFVAAFVEIGAVVRDSVGGPGRCRAGVAADLRSRGGHRVRRLPVDHRRLRRSSFAFSLHVSAGSRVLLFISGAASLILAVLAFRHFGNAVLLLAIWIGVGFIFRGVATTVSAISDPHLPGRGWSIFIGVISLLAGIVVMASPFQSIITLALVVGIWLVVIGVFEVVSAFGIRKASQALRVGIEQRRIDASAGGSAYYYTLS